MTILAGAKVDAADLTRHYTKGSQGTTQSIPNNSFTAIQFNGTDDVDTLGIHDPVTSNTRFNIGLKLGWWQISGKFVCSASGTGARRSRFVLNGSLGVNGGYSAVPLSSGAGFWTSESNTLVQSTLSTDYVEFQGFQDSGGALSTLVSGDLRSQMVCIYLGP